MTVKLGSFFKVGSIGFAVAALAVLSAASIAAADEMSDSAARLKIGQDALIAADSAKAEQYCNAAIVGLPGKASAESDMITADATECQAKALIAQGKNQDACDLIYPVLDMIGVSAAPGKADAKARLKAVLDPEVTAKRCN
jgi:hypothetical protein